MKQDILQNKTSVHISIDAPVELRAWISDQNYGLDLIEPVISFESPIAAHPDIQMCKLGYSDNSPLIKANADELAALDSTYPLDVPFNAACTGKYFIHNLKHTNSRLLEEARKAGMLLVDVAQGYAKCSCVVVDENSIISYDQGIAKAAVAAGMDVLLVSAGHVKLTGYSTGFIGGSSGRLGDTIVFNGNILKHPDGDTIINFIESKGLKCKWFDYELSDIGSIL